MLYQNVSVDSIFISSPFSFLLFLSNSDIGTSEQPKSFVKFKATIDKPSSIHLLRKKKSIQQVPYYLLIMCLSIWFVSFGICIVFLHVIFFNSESSTLCNLRKQQYKCVLNLEPWMTGLFCCTPNIYNILQSRSLCCLFLFKDIYNCVTQHWAVVQPDLRLVWDIWDMFRLSWMMVATDSQTTIGFGTHLIIPQFFLSKMLSQKPSIF